MIRMHHGMSGGTQRGDRLFQTDPRVTLQRVTAHGRVLEPLTRARLEAIFLHQTGDALAADALVLLNQVLVNAGTAGPLAALIA